MTVGNYIKTTQKIYRLLRQSFDMSQHHHAGNATQVKITKMHP